MPPAPQPQPAASRSMTTEPPPSEPSCSPGRSPTLAPEARETRGRVGGLPLGLGRGHSRGQLARAEVRALDRSVRRRPCVQLLGLGLPRPRGGLLRRRAGRSRARGLAGRRRGGRRRVGVGVGVGVLDDRPEVHVTELPSALRTHCMVEPVLVSVPAPGGAGLSALPAGGTGTTDRTGGADEFPDLTVTVLAGAAVVEVEPVFTICRSCWLADCLTACTCAWREEARRGSARSGTSRRQLGRAVPDRAGEHRRDGRRRRRGGGGFGAAGRRVGREQPGDEADGEGERDEGGHEPGGNPPRPNRFVMRAHASPVPRALTRRTVP